MRQQETTWPIISAVDSLYDGPGDDVQRELEELRAAWALAIETSPVDYCAEVRPWS